MDRLKLCIESCEAALLNIELAKHKTLRVAVAASEV